MLNIRKSLRKKNNEVDLDELESLVNQVVEIRARISEARTLVSDHNLIARLGVAEKSLQSISYEIAELVEA